MLPGMSQITQLSPTPGSVINLGQLPNVPLIWPPSELGDGFEPHDTIYLGDRPRGDSTHEHGVPVGGRGVPGVVQEAGYREGAIPGTQPGQPAGQIEAYLWNI